MQTVKAASNHNIRTVMPLDDARKAEYSKALNKTDIYFVIPAQAGIQRRLIQALALEVAPLDSRLRGNDGGKVAPLRVMSDLLTV